MNKSDYYKEYYKNNKDQILDRVKKNYYKKVNKIIEDKKELIIIKKIVDHIYVSF